MKFQLPSMFRVKSVVLQKNYGQNDPPPPPPGLNRVKDHMVRLKIISLYTYKELRLKT